MHIFSFHPFFASLAAAPAISESLIGLLPKGRVMEHSDWKIRGCGRKGFGEEGGLYAIVWLVEAGRETKGKDQPGRAMRGG